LNWSQLFGSHKDIKTDMCVCVHERVCVCVFVCECILVDVNTCIGVNMCKYITMSVYECDSVCQWVSNRYCLWVYRTTCVPVVVNAALISIQLKTWTHWSSPVAQWRIIPTYNASFIINLVPATPINNEKEEGKGKQMKAHGIPFSGSGPLWHISPIFFTMVNDPLSRWREGEPFSGDDAGAFDAMVV
jgi:hypothetical protein